MTREECRRQSVERMKAMMDYAFAQSRTLSPEECRIFDGLEQYIAEIDRDTEREAKVAAFWLQFADRQKEDADLRPKSRTPAAPRGSRSITINPTANPSGYGWPTCSLGGGRLTLHSDILQPTPFSEMELVPTPGPFGGA